MFIHQVYSFLDERYFVSFQFLGHSNLSSQVDKPLRESCLNMIRINTTLWTSTSNGSNSVTSKLVSIIENDCPSDCSVEEEKRGSCNNGML